MIKKTLFRNESSTHRSSLVVLTSFDHEMCALPLTDRTNDRLSSQILDLNFARSQSQQSNRYDSGILMIGTINFCMQNCERTRMNKTCLTSATLTFLCVLLVICIWRDKQSGSIYIRIWFKTCTLQSCCAMWSVWNLLSLWCSIVWFFILSLKTYRKCVFFWMNRYIMW